MTEIWKKDLDLLLGLENNLNVMWDLQTDGDLDVDNSTKEKYREHEDIVLNPWTNWKNNAENWTDQEKEEYLADKPARDGIHESAENYRIIAEKCAEILRSRKWIPSHI